MEEDATDRVNINKGFRGDDSIDAAGDGRDAQLAICKQRRCIQLVANAAIVDFHDEVARMRAANFVDRNLVADLQVTRIWNDYEDCVALMLQTAFHDKTGVARCFQLTERSAPLFQRQVLNGSRASDNTLCSDGNESCGDGGGGGIAEFQRAAVDGDRRCATNCLQRQSACAFLGDSLTLKESRKRHVLIKIAYLISGLSLQHTIGSRSADGANLQRGALLVATAACIVGNVGVGINLQRGLRHIGNVGHQAPLAARGCQHALIVFEVETDVAAHIFRYKRKVSLSLYATVYFSTRGTYYLVAGPLLYGNDMIESGYGGRAVHINLMHLAATEQHGLSALSEGSVPGTLCHDTLFHDEPCKVVRAAIREIQLSGSILDQITVAAYLTF